jgi:predicted lipoprotein with Yx(FWY)xxD motif
MRKSILMAIIPFAALLAAACGSSSKTTSHTTSAPGTSASQSAKGSVAVSAKTIKPYGTVLVNSSGHALYTFAPDKASKVTCTSACAKIWPPLTLPGGAKPTGSGAVKASLLGSDPNPAGGRVVTYNGWPLYTYVTDTSAGVAHGQGLNLNGGFWYLISPSGTPVKSKSTSSSSSNPY